MTLRTPPSPPIKGVDTIPEQETRTAPPKRWRNKYRRSLDMPRWGFCFECGAAADRPAGEIYWSHCAVYLSRDIAETRAHELLARQSALGVTPDEYLGAFPVEEGE